MNHYADLRRGAASDYDRAWHQPQPTRLPNEVWDVIVVGAGAAGLAAALEAKKSGAQVLLIEKMGNIGGNSVMSAGMMAVPGTPMQIQAGLNDSIERFEQDLLTLGSINQPDRIRILANKALETFLWTQQELGVQWYDDRVEYDEGHSVRRCAILKTGSGEGLIYPLYERCVAMGVEIRLNTQLVHIVRDPDTGIVRGCLVKDGSTSESGPGRHLGTRRGLVITSGGFGTDIGMRMMQNWRLSERVGTTTQPGSTSEVIRELSAIGAWTLHLQYIHCFPDASPDEKGPGNAWRFARYCAAARGVWIQRETGERFVNERAASNVRTHAILDVLSQNGHCHALADARAVERPRSVIFSAKDVEKLVARGLVRRYPTLDDLAHDNGIPYKRLLATLRAYNKALQAGADRDAMGRPIERDAVAIEEGPWYISNILAKVHLCGGGVAIDRYARVLSIEDDRPISGLYAAGEVTGGLHGVARLTSCGLLDALVFGRIAGMMAADGL